LKDSINYIPKKFPVAQKKMATRPPTPDGLCGGGGEQA